MAGYAINANGNDPAAYLAHERDAALEHVRRYQAKADAFGAVSDLVRALEA